jgi:glyoxylase-like metal-dependent hydrolase (beta-lactamase superfamily II)
MPSFSFLIEHPTGRKLLFDLGLRKDWESLAPSVVEMMKSNSSWEVHVSKNVADILQENEVPTAAIEAIVWSHWHCDHTGDPSTFPSNTSLVVGPGFKEAMTPAWPSAAESPLNEADWEGRELHEISFNEGLRIGGFEATDYFDDGSFFLLDCPGHTVGHLCGLARVTSSPDTYIFLGADACHFPGQFRPSEYRPLPDEIQPSPSPRFHDHCPGALFRNIHPTGSRTEPFYKRSASGPYMDHDQPEALESTRKIQLFDAADDVFVVIAHDASLLGRIDFFPKDINNWYLRKEAAKVQWQFLAVFET